jgi:hypothetical protein
MVTISRGLCGRSSEQGRFAVSKANSVLTMAWPRASATRKFRGQRLAARDSVLVGKHYPHRAYPLALDFVANRPRVVALRHRPESMTLDESWARETRRLGLHLIQPIVTPTCRRNIEQPGVAATQAAAVKEKRSCSPGPRRSRSG